MSPPAGAASTHWEGWFYTGSSAPAQGCHTPSDPQSSWGFPVREGHGGLLAAVGWLSQIFESDTGGALTSSPGVYLGAYIHSVNIY